jgi:hypothetical protein
VTVAVLTALPASAAATGVPLSLIRPTVTVEMRFDVQLEGQSMFGFWPLNGGVFGSNAHMLALWNRRWTLQRT